LELVKICEIEEKRFLTEKISIPSSLDNTSFQKRSNKYELSSLIDMFDSPQSLAQSEVRIHSRDPIAEQKAQKMKLKHSNLSQREKVKIQSLNMANLYKSHNPANYDQFGSSSRIGDEEGISLYSNLEKRNKKNRKKYERAQLEQKFTKKKYSGKRDKVRDHTKKSSHKKAKKYKSFYHKDKNSNSKSKSKFKSKTLKRKRSKKVGELIVNSPKKIFTQRSSLQSSFGKGEEYPNSHKSAFLQQKTQSARKKNFSVSSMLKERKKSAGFYKLHSAQKSKMNKLP